MLDVTRAYGLNFLFPEGDTAIGGSLRAYGEFARVEVEYIHEHLRRHEAPGVFLDVGANIGSIALPIANAHRRWKVIAIEAHRGLAGVLTANALNNHLYNVEAINAAVGPAPGLARFPSASLASKLNFGVLGMHLNETAPTEAVRMCTLDEIAPQNVQFVKMDVEGFEAEVLRGAGDLIAARKAVWLLEANNRTRASAVECMRMFLDAGYALHWLWAPFVVAAPRKANPEPPKIKGDLNFVALPPDVPNIWDLSPVIDPDGDWPSMLSAFRYLERFGFKLAIPI